MLAACACSVYGTTNIVHDAARDLVLNTASKAVYTNFYGGVWSFMRSTSYTGERTLMPSVRYYEGPGTDGSGTNYFGADLKIQWERGPAKNDGVGYNLPVIAVNPSPWADTNAYLRGAAYPAIPPGALSCHPGDPKTARYPIKITLQGAGTLTCHEALINADNRYYALLPKTTHLSYSPTSITLYQQNKEILRYELR